MRKLIKSSLMNLSEGRSFILYIKVCGDESLEQKNTKLKIY